MRAIWSGSIAFGLINIPVQIYSASEERALKFRMLTKKDHEPISYARVAAHTHKEVPYKEIVKGYEFQKGDFVILTDEDFEKVAPKKTKTVDIVSFADECEIPSLLISKPYFIEPSKRSEKAYVLLREALKRSKKVGIAKWVLRNKEHVAMVRPEDGALMLIDLRFADELRKPDDLHIPNEAEYSKKELDMAVALIGQLEENFKITDYKDTYTAELKKIIAQKAKGKPIKVMEEEEPVATDMRELMHALERSLAEEKRREKVSSR